MSLQNLLDARNISKYRLSQISGVPKTTILDICSGKSSLENCSAKTVYNLALALDFSVEDFLINFCPEMSKTRKENYNENKYI